MEDIKIEDYGDFTAGVNTITTLNNDITDQKKAIETCKSTLENDAVFMGPVAESIGETLFELSSLVTIMADNFIVMGNLLTQVGNSFKQTDSEAVKIIAITEEGKYKIVKQDSVNKMFVDSLNSELGNTMEDYSDTWHGGNWCADYVSYQLEKNGYNYEWAIRGTTDSDEYSIIKSMKDGGAKIHYGQNAADSEGRTLTDEDKNYVPQAGDVFTIEVEDGEGPGHTGFIVKDNGDGTVTTIEGNTFKEEPGYKEKFINDELPGVVETHIRKKEDIYAYATPSK